MTTTANIGYGSIFRVENAAGSGVYTQLAMVTDITPPSDTSDIIDVTSMDSPLSEKEFIQGLSDPGDCALTMNWEPSSATDALIRAWRVARETRSAQIVFPNGAIWTFGCFVKSYVPKVPTLTKMEATLTCKVSGSTVVS